MILEKLFEFLIGFAKADLSARTSSRRRAARGFVRLYTALTDCHDAYLDLHPNLRSGGEMAITNLSASEDFNRRSEELMAALESIRTELRILAPDAHQVLVSHAVHELTHAFAVYAEKRRLPAELSAAESNVHLLLSDPDEYTRSEGLLREFIAKEFQIEDLF